MPIFHFLPEPEVEPVVGFTSDTYGLAQRARAWIAIEGPSGTGKTTLCERLQAALEVNGISHTFVRYPGGTPGGEALRDRLRQDKSLSVLDRAELLAGNRVDIHDSVVAPALKTDCWIVQDRFHLSALIYQGIVEGAGIENIAEIDRRIYGARAKPDMTFVLWVPPEVAMARVLKRAEESQMPPGRFEGDLATHAAVSDAYLQIVRGQPNTCLIDASQSPEDVFGNVMSFINDGLLNGKIAVNRARRDMSMEPEVPDRLPPRARDMAFPGTAPGRNVVEP